MNTFSLSLFTVIIYSATISCNYNSNNYDVYNDVSSNIPSELRIFFPNYLDCSWANLTFNNNPFHNVHQSKSTFYYLAVKTRDFEKISRNELSTAKRLYSFSDTCNIIVNKYQRDDGFSSPSGSEWLYYRWIKSLDACSADRLPIPNFAGLEHPYFVEGVGLSDDFDIIVQDASNEKNLPNRYYSDNVIMPSAWTHGHSRGICIDSKKEIIIWWLVVW